MTTKVTIENDANSQHTIRVVHVEFDEGKSRSRDTQQLDLQPGHKAEFYVYALRDLRIEEMGPPPMPSRKEP